MNSIKVSKFQNAALYILLSLVPLLFAITFDTTISCAEAERASFSFAEKLFLQGRYDKAVSELDILIDARSPRRDEMYYLKGLSELKLNRFTDARESFEAVIFRYPASHRLFEAYIGAGDSYFLAGDINTALKKYEEILNRFSGDRNIPLVYHRLGSSYRKLGESKKAEYYFDKLKKCAPLSFEAAMPGDLDIEVMSPGTVTQEKAPSAKNTFTRTENHLYSVQVGSFRNKKNAEKMAHKLYNTGYDSYMETPGASSGQYKVKVGKYRSKEEAENTAGRLKKDGYTVRICNGDVCQ